MVALRKESVDRNMVVLIRYTQIIKSLSARRAWIEIFLEHLESLTDDVALRKESVDRNSLQPE